MANARPMSSRDDGRSTGIAHEAMHGTVCASKIGHSPAKWEERTTQRVSAVPCEVGSDLGRRRSGERMSPRLPGGGAFGGRRGLHMPCRREGEACGSDGRRCQVLPLNAAQLAVVGRPSGGQWLPLLIDLDEDHALSRADLHLTRALRHADCEGQRRGEGAQQHTGGDEPAQHALDEGGGMHHAIVGSVTFVKLAAHQVLQSMAIALITRPAATACARIPSDLPLSEMPTHRFIPADRQSWGTCGI